jgi:hypothetical protein
MGTASPARVGPDRGGINLCELCQTTFPNEGALRSHQKLQHGVAPNPVELQYFVPHPSRVAPDVDDAGPGPSESEGGTRADDELRSEEDRVSDEPPPEAPP